MIFIRCKKLRKIMVVVSLVGLLVTVFKPLTVSVEAINMFEQQEKITRESVEIVINGSGTLENPYLIDSIEKLQSIGTGNYGLDKHYKLTKNLDFNNNSSYLDSNNKDEYTTGKGFKPIGDIEAMDFDPKVNIPFSGTFDGNNKSISNLYINRATFDISNKNNGGITVGLFGGIMGNPMKPASIKDLELINPNIIGANRVGAIAGAAMFTKFENCKVTKGSVTGTATPSIEGNIEDFVGRTTSTGGMLGMVYCKGGGILNCSSSATVNGTDAVGGLVGYNYGNEIKNSYATGNVTGHKFVGGLSGCNIGTAMNMGGMPPKLVYIYSRIENSYATGEVIGTDGSSEENGVGGLVGYNHVFAEIKNSYATSNVIGKQNTGGLVGHNNLGTIENCFATGDVNGTHNIGGLIGKHQKNIFSGVTLTTEHNPQIRNNIAFNNKVTGEYSIGKVIGNNFAEPITNNLYSNINMTILENGENIESGIDITVSQFMDKYFYTNALNWDTTENGQVWDFNQIWVIGNNSPVHKWQNTSSGNHHHSRRKTTKKVSPIKPDNSYYDMDTIVTDIRNNNKVSKEFFDLVSKGKEVNFKNDFYTLTFSGGENISKIDTDIINLGASKNLTNENKINDLIGKKEKDNFSFAHRDDFPSTARLTLEINKKYSDSEVYVYRFNEDTSKLEIVGLLKTTSEGEITFDVNKGGDYIISEDIIPTSDIYKENIDDIGYIEGYGNGKFGPDDNITRGQTATMLSNILRKSDIIDEEMFKDINMWAKESILQLESLGYIDGYNDGTFKPDKSITRAEFVKIIVNVFNVECIQSYKEVLLTDIENNWAKNEIEICYGLGIINGYNNLFRPNDFITRADAVKIINKIINREVNIEGKTNRFDDVSEDHWAYEDIIRAIK